MPKLLTVWITTNWKILEEMGIPYHLTYLLRNLYAGQEATVRTRHGQWTGSNLGECVKAIYCHPAYLAYMQHNYRVLKELIFWQFLLTFSLILWRKGFFRVPYFVILLTSKSFLNLQKNIARILIGLGLNIYISLGKNRK